MHSESHNFNCPYNPNTTHTQKNIKINKSMTSVVCLLPASSRIGDFSVAGSSSTYSSSGFQREWNFPGQPRRLNLIFSSFSKKHNKSHKGRWLRGFPQQKYSSSWIKDTKAVTFSCTDVVANPSGGSEGLTGRPGCPKRVGILSANS